MWSVHGSSSLVVGAWLVQSSCRCGRCMVGAVWLSMWSVQWPYEEFISIVPTVKGPTGNEFTITMKKNSKKTDTMRFSTDHRADLLTEALRFRHLFAEKVQSTTKV